MAAIQTLNPATQLGLILETKNRIEGIGGRAGKKARLGRKLRRPPRQRFPLTLERAYMREIRSISNVGDGLIEQLLIPRLGEIQRLAGIRDEDRSDIETWASVLASVFQDIRQRMAEETDQRIEDTANRFGNDLSIFNRDEIRRQMRSVVGVDIFLNEPELIGALQSFTADNVGLIKSIPNRGFSEIEGLVTRAFRGGRRAGGVADQIRERFKVSQGRANLIGRDQISKLYGDLTRQRQTGLGIEQYIWRTSRDERVRESHRALEGTVQSWDDPPFVGNGRNEHPGGDFQCRCSAEGIIPGVTPIKTTPKDVKRNPELVARARNRAARRQRRTRRKAPVRKTTPTQASLEAARRRTAETKAAAKAAQVRATEARERLAKIKSAPTVVQQAAQRKRIAQLKRQIAKIEKETKAIDLINTRAERRKGR